MNKDIKKALEHCVEWDCVDCPNREELGSGETVCRGRLLPEVLKYVADLEEKLADMETNKEKEINRICKTHIEANAQLKQKLAEKEKEIESYERLTEQYEHELEVYKHNDDLYANSIRKFANKNKQDKISFAVEQLEKIKEWVIRQLFIITKDCSNLEEVEAKGCNELREETIKEIDNQIKQLKEMK